MKTLKERYLTDTKFYALTESLYKHLENANVPPYEFRDAAAMAEILFYYRRETGIFLQKREDYKE